jgi:hypothetical protein
VPVTNTRRRAARRIGNRLFTLFRQHGGMNVSRTFSELEADLVALRAAAERAGTALACLFSSSDEFEAAVVKMRREQGAFRGRNRRRPIWSIALIAVAVIAFMLF